MEFFGKRPEFRTACTEPLHQPKNSGVNSAALTRPKARAPRQATRSSPRIREQLQPRE